VLLEECDEGGAGLLGGGEVVGEASGAAESAVGEVMWLWRSMGWLQAARVWASWSERGRCREEMRWRRYQLGTRRRRAMVGGEAGGGAARRRGVFGGESFLRLQCNAMGGGALSGSLYSA
jgi:hypothetical protein